MRSLLDIFTILSFVVWSARLVLAGYLSLQSAVLAMVGLTMLVGLARAFKMSFAGLALKVGLPVAALVVLAAQSTGGDRAAMREVLATAAALVFVLFGIYLMVARVIRPRRSGQ